MESWDTRALEVMPHQPQVLSSDAETRVVALELPGGEMLQDHQTHERTFLVVVHGEVEIAQGDGSVKGGPGLLAHFAPNERREVRALSDSRILLLLAPWPGEGHPSQRAAGA
jgi:quercetin dioxygenase-like cupin family protein